MVYYVETAGQKTWVATDLEESEFSAVSAKWVFEFADGSIGIMSNSNSAWSNGELDLSFVIPEDFFTPARAGPCEHQVIIYDSDNSPIYYSEKYKDVVRHPILKKSVADT